MHLHFSFEKFRCTQLAKAIIKTDRASLLDARSVLYDNPLLLLISLVSFLKLYKTSHELSIVLSFFVVFSKIIKVLSSPATLRTNSPASMPHWPGWWRAAPWLLCRSGRKFDTSFFWQFNTNLLFKPFVAYFFVKFHEFVSAFLCWLWYNRIN